MGTIILKRKTYSDSESFGFKVKRAADHTWKIVKGAGIGAGIGAIGGGFYTFGNKYGIIGGAALGAGVGGMLGHHIATVNPIKSKEQLEREAKLKNEVPKWIDRFMEKFNNLVKSENERIKNSCIKEYNLDKLGLSQFDDFFIYLYFPDFYNGSNSFKEVNGETIIELGWIKGDHENGACSSLDYNQLLWNFNKKSAYFSKSNFNYDTSNLVEIKNEKQLAKIVADIYKRNVSLDQRTALSYICGGDDKYLDVPKEYLDFYVDEFNKSRKNIIKQLENWR